MERQFERPAEAQERGLARVGLERPEGDRHQQLQEKRPAHRRAGGGDVDPPEQDDQECVHGTPPKKRPPGKPTRPRIVAAPRGLQGR